MGCRTAVLTSTDPAYNLENILPDISIERVVAEQTTTFENVYLKVGRQQTLRSRAKNLAADHVPDNWQRASIVHLGPVANEIDPDIVNLFSNSLIGLTPQGWFRRWRDDGRVYIGEWREADDILPYTAATIVSLEDLPDSSWIERFRRVAPVVVLTQQEDGCTVFCHGESRHFAAPTVREVNPTGAGDIFASAFFVRLHQTKGNPWEAAQFANRIAAHSVAHESLEAKLQSIKEQIDGEISV
jgi:sugar/nucleoside kinase (ribokinase family)